MAESLHPFQDTDEIRKERALPNVNPKSNVSNFAMLLIAEIDKGREECKGKIIDAEIPGILKCLEGIGFTRTGQPAYDDQIQPGHRSHVPRWACPRYSIGRRCQYHPPDSTRWNALFLHGHVGFAHPLWRLGYAKG